jgi:hypothetical protein
MGRICVRDEEEGGINFEEEFEGDLAKRRERSSSHCPLVDLCHCMLAGVGSEAVT